MFITPAYAQGAGGAGGSVFELLFPLIAVAAIMWFLIIRPQRQQAKQREEMLGAIRRNDTVVTSGGMIGKVTKVVDETELEVQIATDTKVRVSRAYIAEVRVKGEPVKADKAGKAPAKASSKAPAKGGSKSRK